MPERLQSATALSLLALLGALGSGLPSHSHVDRQVPVGQDSHVVAADHHTHGTQLVEQDERAPSGCPRLAEFPAVAVAVTAAVVSAVQVPDTDVPRPRERAPPPGAPRAPPFAL
jgi:hypothetical protein